MSILLTTDEIEKEGLEEQCVDCRGYGEIDVARLQLKKVVEWGRETCFNHLSPMGGLPVKRHGCEMCWQSLRGE